MNRLIICDAGPLIALAKINCLCILKKIFDEVIAPEAVIKECLSNLNLPGAQKIKAALDQNIILSKKISLTNYSIKITPTLDLLDNGEKEAIIMAKEYNAELLIDEKQGRKIAKSLDLKIIGIASLLLIAYKKGLISDLEDYLNQLKFNGYRLSERLISEVLYLSKQKISTPT